MTGKYRQKPPSQLALILVSVSVSLVIIVSGSVYVRNLRQSVIKSKSEELNALADLKVMQVVRWWHERIGDALLVQGNSWLIKSAGNYILTGNPEDEKDLRNYFTEYLNTFDYRSVLLVDDNNRVRLSLPENVSTAELYLHPLIPEITESYKITLSDIHQSDRKSQPEIDLIIPFYIRKGMSDSTRIYMMLSIDPEKILYPLISTWPSESRSSETLLVRKEGDSVLYLNPLRYPPEETPLLRRSISDTNLLATKAVLGKKGKTEGVDYRGVKVLGNIKRIPGSGWYMVAKTDISELNEIILKQVLPIRLLFIFIVSVLVTITGWTIYRQRARFYKQMYESEMEQMALRKHFDYILKFANDIVLLADEDLNIAEVNDTALEAYNYSRNEMIGMNIRHLRLPEDEKELEEKVDLLDRSGSATYETVHRRKDGTIFPVEVSARRFEIEGKKYFQSISRDITQRKLYEDQLKAAKEKAEESDRLKTAFLHNISHEIRTPMNAIVGFTALLDEPDVDESTRKHFIDIIYQSTNQLLGIISDIVDISNIEAGQVKLNLTEVNVNSVIRGLYDQYSIIAEKQKILFHYDLMLEDEQTVIFTDKTKLVQIISNLLNNAFKFTHQGTVAFGYRVEPEKLVFYVRDTGIGIPEDKMHMIFERFYQVESDSSRKFTGAGLGLSISKAYVEILGGSICAVSSPGKGSEFSFTLPF